MDFRGEIGHEVIAIEAGSRLPRGTFAPSICSIFSDESLGEQVSSGDDSHKRDILRRARLQLVLMSDARSERFISQGCR